MHYNITTLKSPENDEKGGAETPQPKFRLTDREGEIKSTDLRLKLESSKATNTLEDPESLYFIK